jgi:hypothetical protein
MYLVHTDNLEAGFRIQPLSILIKLPLLSIELAVGIVMNLPDCEQILS